MFLKDEIHPVWVHLQSALMVTHQFKFTQTHDHPDYDLLQNKNFPFAAVVQSIQSMNDSGL